MADQPACAREGTPHWFTNYVSGSINHRPARSINNSTSINWGDSNTLMPRTAILPRVARTEIRARSLQR